MLPGDFTVSGIEPVGDMDVRGSTDKTLKLWDMATAKCLQTIEGHTGPVWAVSLDDDTGHGALSGSSDRHVMLWDLRAGVCSRAMLQHQRQVTMSPRCANVLHGLRWAAGLVV